MVETISDDKQVDELGSEKMVGEGVAVGTGDASPLPKGTIDPVYEAKARVLNRAVCTSWLPEVEYLILADSRHWYGLVSVATLHRRGFWLGQR